MRQAFLIIVYYIYIYSSFSWTLAHIMRVAAAVHKPTNFYSLSLFNLLPNVDPYFETTGIVGIARVCCNESGFVVPCSAIAYITTQFQ